MSAKAVQSAVKAAPRVMPVNTKYTIQSTGIWERLRRVLAVDPTRSNGVPLNPQFRNPTPGALDPLSYTDAVTLPAADIAENPYWKRDHRRAYPRASVLGQGDVVALLSVGSEAKPKMELIGEAGSKALVSAQESGEKGVAAFFRETKDIDLAAVLEEGNLPPMPSAMGGRKVGDDVKYGLTEQSYDISKYGCRSFA